MLSWKYQWHFSSLFTTDFNVTWQETLSQLTNKRIHMCKPVTRVNLLFSSPFSIPSQFLSIWCGYHGNRGCAKRKLYWEWVIFSINFSLSYSSALTFSLCLPPSFAESQAVWGAINIINQHNSTALSSAGRDEEARGNVNMLAWSSLNQWYISHITWMREGAQKERQSGTAETDRERQITEEWKYAF